MPASSLYLAMISVPARPRGECVLDFNLSGDQALLRDQIGRFVQERCGPDARPGHVTPAVGFDPENWALLAELGVLALPFDADAGGLGGTAEDVMIVAEGLGRGVVAEPWLSEILFAGGLIAKAGASAQKDKWLPAIMSGEAHLAVAFAEQQTRFAFDAAATRYDGENLHGSKTFVLAGSACDAFIVTAHGPDGTLGLFLIEADAPGLMRQAYRLIDGSPAAELYFSGAPAEAMDGGFAAFSEHIDSLRMPIAAELVGLMSILFETTLGYVRERKQFGAPIGSFQAIQHRMARQYLALEQSRSHLYRAALSDQPERRAAALAAKSYISTAAVRLGEEAIQLHGGMGVTDELIVGHAHKRALLLASLFGDADTEARRYLAATDAIEKRHLGHSRKAAPAEAALLEGDA